MDTAALSIILIMAVVALFMLVHKGRELKRESFEINTQNKNTQKGFQFYEDEIMEIMRSLRYTLVQDEKELKVWTPSVRGRVMGGDFKMERTPYSITIEGPRGTVRVVVSMLDIKKIFI